MLALKAVLGSWLMPLPLSLTLICCGLLLRVWGRRRSAATLVAAGVIVTFAAATGPIADALLRPLERRYQAIADAAALSPRPRFVVVLGSGYRPRSALSVTAEVDAAGMVRLAEGIRLLHQLAGARLILSGGPVRGEPPVAQGYARVAVALGISTQDMVLLETARDTREEIHAIRAYVGDAPVLLVTSAAHMPRAMACAVRSGLRAIAAPTGNLADPDPRAQWWPLGLPSGTALRRTETALHEYLGLLALELGTS